MLQKLLLLSVEICDMRVSISYFDQVSGKRESQTRQVFNFAGIYFHNFVVLLFCNFIFEGRKFRENDRKLRKSRNFIPLRWKKSIKPWNRECRFSFRSFVFPHHNLLNGAKTKEQHGLVTWFKRLMIDTWTYQGVRNVSFSENFDKYTWICSIVEIERKIYLLWPETLFPKFTLLKQRFDFRSKNV